MGVKITDMTSDSNVTGAELFPVSDGGSPKKMSVSQVKDFVVDQIEAVTAGTSVTGADGVYILQSGALKPIDVDVIAQYVIDTVWGKTAEASPSGANVVPLKNGSTEKTMTLTVMAEFVRATIEAAVLDVSNLSSAGTLTDADLALVTQSATGKKVTLATLATYVLGALDTYVSALGAVSSPADSDVFYVIQSGTEKKVTWATLKAAVGNCFAPATTTENNIPQWSSAQKTLKDGLTVQTTVRASGSAVDTAVPTEKSVRDVADRLVYNQADIAADLEDGDTVMVDDGGAGTTQRKSALSRLWTYVWSKVTGATSKTTPVDADSIGIVDSAASNVVKNLTFANFWANYGLAKVKAGVKLDELAAPTDVTTLNATAALHGLMSKTDKAKLDAIEAAADVTDATNVDAAGATMNSDTNVKSNSWVVDEDNMASNLDTKVPTQQSVKAYVDTANALDVKVAATTTAGMGFVVDEDNMASNLDTKLPTQQSVKAYVDTKFAAAGVDITTAPAKGAGVDADKAIISDSADSGAAKTFTLSNLWNYIEQKILAVANKTTPVDADIFMIQDSAASFSLKELTLANLWSALTAKFLTASNTPATADADTVVFWDASQTNRISRCTQAEWWTNYGFAKVKAGVKLDELTSPTDVTTLDASASTHGLMPKLDKIKLDALCSSEVDGTLSTGANNDFAPTKLVYNKTCSDSDGDDVIDLHDATVVGRIVTIYLGTKSGTDGAVITPVTKLGYSTITLSAANQIATLQWQGSTLGWVILRTTGTVA